MPNGHPVGFERFETNYPFEMEDYTASFFAQTILANALGYQQRRNADGEEVLTMGN